MNLSLAIEFASSKHVNQLDKGGYPYILHPIRMMTRLRTTDQELMAIAILHDVVEDCGVTYDDLRSLGMPDRVIAGVRALTKLPGFTYEQFIENLAGNRDALLVKREDLRDNSDITRMKGIREKDMDRLNKYARAYARVEELLKEI
jgi:GTP diphosphokinase / guanosine-3',5'-bis(diphosphate) 3'-diphosphatase